jgi:hypothetical protein
MQIETLNKKIQNAQAKLSKAQNLVKKCQQPSAMSRKTPADEARQAKAVEKAQKAEKKAYQQLENLTSVDMLPFLNRGSGKVVLSGPSEPNNSGGC